MPQHRSRKPAPPRSLSAREQAELAVIRAELKDRIDCVAWMRKVKREAARPMNPRGPWHMTPEVYDRAEAVLIASGQKPPPGIARPGIASPGGSSDGG